jgi:hypothetical protein
VYFIYEDFGGRPCAPDLPGDAPRWERWHELQLLDRLGLPHGTVALNQPCEVPPGHDHYFLRCAANHETALHPLITGTAQPPRPRRRPDGGTR